MQADVTINKQRVGRRFSRHAASYDQHARVQQAMAEQLLERIRAHGLQPRSILELGCGTGHLTERLARCFPAARITAIDLAESMVRATRARLGEAHRVELTVGDAEQACWNGRRFDLVVSNATIQWFATPETTMKALAQMLEPCGVMLHATFGPRTFEELFAVLDHVEAGRGLPPKRRGLPLRTLEQWRALLRSGGLGEVEIARRIERREYDCCRSLLAEIRGTGASFSPAAPRELSLLTEVMRRYDSDHRAPGGSVHATYEVLELAARKPPPAEPERQPCAADATPSWLAGRSST